MSQAIVDPDELDRFRRHLKDFGTQLNNMLSSLRGHFSALGSTWRDEVQQKFNDEVEKMSNSVKRFTTVSAQHVIFLEKKVREARTYLGKG